MKTGIELIAAERQEQISKHGFSLERDKEFYQSGQLIDAALFCMDVAANGENAKSSPPTGWVPFFEEKIRSKSKIGALKVAGAFYMAETERKGDHAEYATEIAVIASLIDIELQNDPNSKIN